MIEKIKLYPVALLQNCLSYVIVIAIISMLDIEFNIGLKIFLLFFLSINAFTVDRLQKEAIDEKLNQ